MRSTEHRTATDAAAHSWIQRLLGWFCFTVLMIPGAAPGMDFKIYYQPQLKLKMVIAEGSIHEGDADKFLAFAKLADRDDEGLVILVLNSPGGNVEAAFRMVDAMDNARVYTTVPIVQDAPLLAPPFCSLQANAGALLVLDCSVSTVATDAMGKPMPRTRFATK